MPPSKITAVRVEIDYSVTGRRDITVTDDQGNPPHEYRREPTAAQFKKCFDKIFENADQGTPMTFWVDDKGYLISDPVDPSA